MKKLKILISKTKKRGLKYIFLETVPWLFYDKFDDLLGRIIKKIYIKKPLQNVIVLESHNDFDSNGGAFYNYLIENRLNEKYKIVWFLRNRCPQHLPKNVEGYRYNRLSIKRWYYHCIAKYFLSEHYPVSTIREGQIAVYMRHGAGGLKKVTNYFSLPEGIQYILGLSKSYAHIEKLENFFTGNNQKILYLGFPSHDYLFNSDLKELNKITKRRFKKVILWMPTFRKTADGRNDSNVDFPLGIPLFTSYKEYESLNNILKEFDYLLIIKIHPMQDLSTLKIKNLSHIYIITGEDMKKMGIDNYKLMPCCDAMISDYSGAAYDFIQLDKPIAYVLSDMNEYKIGFVVDDIHSLLGGKEIYSIDDMIEFIKDLSTEKDVYKEKRENLKNFLYTYHDGNNCKRLADFLGLKP